MKKARALEQNATSEPSGGGGLGPTEGCAEGNKPATQAAGAVEAPRKSCTKGGGVTIASCPCLNAHWN